MDRVKGSANGYEKYVRCERKLIITEDPAMHHHLKPNTAYVVFAENHYCYKVRRKTGNIKKKFARLRKDLCFVVENPPEFMLK